MRKCVRGGKLSHIWIAENVELYEVTWYIIYDSVNDWSEFVEILRYMEEIINEISHVGT